MFTPTNDPEDPFSFMDQYSSLLSPFTCFEMDGYDNSIPDCYHEESVLLSAGNNIAESSNEPVSASSKMDVTINYQGDFNGIVEQDNSRDTTNNDGLSKQNSSRRRASKADRHSKIPTAQGLRDRRVRLSLDVARQFFKLHEDLLSYDKPSQTIKWLLMQAGPAIEELKETKENRPSCTNKGGIKGVSSNSELGEEVVENTIHQQNGSDSAPKVINSSSKEKVKHMRKDAFNKEAKELRKKARERARDRTQKKHQSVDIKPFYRIEQQIEDEGLRFGGIAQDFNDTTHMVSANWSQNYYHQEDQTCQFKPIQDFQFHGWEPYYE